ncbi:unnamed protein product [Rhodiola kirilowii]
MFAERKLDYFLKRKTPSSASDDRDSTANTVNIVPQGSFALEYVDLNDLPWDPADRKKIREYHPNQRDEIRRKYLLRGPCQPRGHSFPQKLIAGSLRRFNVEWFDQYGNWLEYSIKGDTAFCLCCYLFKDSGKDAFVIEGFSSWNKPERLASHVGNINSFHNRSIKRGDDLMRQAQSIAVALTKQSKITKNEHRIRLNASIDVSRLFLNQGLPFRGHDECEESNNQGNFMELIKYTASLNQSINNVVIGEAPGNNQMVSPKIQKNIVHCFSQEVIRRIIEEIGDDVFALLVDESSDVSYKEQMAVILRFVDKYGIIKERFIGVIHVKDTSSMSLKSAIDSLFSEYGLSLKSVRRQGYDGASNMKGEFNGLRALISKENSSAYYVHCFAHQLQLVIVAISKKHFEVGDFFEKSSLLLNVVGASCKRRDMIREKHQEKVREVIDNHEIRTGSGLNQELSLQRPANTRWGSHYKTLLQFIDRFNEVNSELLMCMASLSPTELFRHFDMLKLMRLAEFYPNDFDFGDRMALEHQLRIYIDNVRQDERFMNLNDLGALARVMVDTGKHLTYILVFRLLKLVLTLPVATATVERCFSSMKIVKTNLRNRMADSFLCGCLICYIEKDLFHTVSNDDVIERFMKMRTRREQL